MVYYFCNHVGVHKVVVLGVTPKLSLGRVVENEGESNVRNNPGINNWC